MDAPIFDRVLDLLKTGIDLFPIYQAGHTGRDHKLTKQGEYIAVLIELHKVSKKNSLVTELRKYKVHHPENVLSLSNELQKAIQNQIEFIQQKIFIYDKSLVHNICNALYYFVTGQIELPFEERSDTNLSLSEFIDIYTYGLIRLREVVRYSLLEAGILERTNDKQVEDQEESFADDEKGLFKILSFKNVSHRILLLHELGILQHLVDRYGNLNKYQMSSLIYGIFSDEHIEHETIRKAIEHVQLSKNHKKTLKTNQAIKKIAFELEKLGIIPEEIYK